METKVWYTSKTILMNMLLGVLGAVSVAWPHASFLMTWINEHMGMFAAGWGIMGTILRFVTKDKVTLTD